MCYMLPIELRCWRAVRLNCVKEQAALHDSGREFQIEDPQNARLVLYRSMRGRGTMYFVEPYLSEPLQKKD